MKNKVQVITSKNFYIIEIFKKKNIFDVFGEEIKKSIKELGISNIQEVKVSNLYKIYAKSQNKKIFKKIAEELLIDNVSEDYKIYKKVKKSSDYHIIEIYLKDGVTDPVGETATKTILESGILKDVSVKTGKKYYLKGTLKEKEIKDICEKILANTLIQNYFIYKRS